MAAAKQTETESKTETYTHAADGTTCVVETERDKTWAETHGYLSPAQVEAEKKAASRTQS